MDNLIEIFGREAIIEIYRERGPIPPAPPETPWALHDLVMSLPKKRAGIAFLKARLEAREDDYEQVKKEHFKFLVHCHKQGYDKEIIEQIVIPSFQTQVAKPFERELNRRRWQLDIARGKRHSELSPGDIDRAHDGRMEDFIENPPKNHLVHCPFHSEQTPSCRIYPHHYHCYGCQAHGSVIDWVMQLHHVSFKESVQIILKR